MSTRSLVALARPHLAELADAKALRDRVQPRRIRADRLRELIAIRRRLAS